MTVKEAQQRIDVDEFAHWLAFYSVSPFGDVRADWRLGNLAAMVGNMFAKKGAPRFKTTDFIYGYKEKKTPQQMGMIFGQFARAWNRHVDAKKANEARKKKKWPPSVPST